MSAEQEATEDRMYLQEIINDLEKNGYVRGGKAQTMLRDWSASLRAKAPRTRGKLKQVHADLVGRELYYPRY